MAVNSTTTKHPAGWWMAAILCRNAHQLKCRGRELTARLGYNTVGTPSSLLCHALTHNLGAESTDFFCSAWLTLAKIWVWFWLCQNQAHPHVLSLNIQGQDTGHQSASSSIVIFSYWNNFLIYLFLGSLCVLPTLWQRHFLLLIQSRVKDGNAELEPIDSWLIAQGMVRMSPASTSLSPPPQPPPNPPLCPRCLSPHHHTPTHRKLLHSTVPKFPFTHCRAGARSGCLPSLTCLQAILHHAVTETVWLCCTHSSAVSMRLVVLPVGGTDTGLHADRCDGEPTGTCAWLQLCNVKGD